MIAGAGTASGVAIYDAQDGARLWSRLDLAGVWWRDGILLSTKDAAALVELDPATGDVVRELVAAEEGMTIMNGSSAEVILCSKASRGGTDYSDQQSRTYRCVKAEKGEVLWERDVAADVWRVSEGRSPQPIMYLIPGSLGESWIGRWHDDTFACSRTDGRVLWWAPYRCGSVASVHDGRVFGMDEGGVFHVLDERTGKLLARHDGTGLEGAMFPGPAAMLGPYAVYGMESGHVAVFDPRDGRLVWSKRHKSGTPNVGVVEGRVYVTTEKGELLVYEPTGPIE
jgi:outer membrane protein assembly factor BamB